MTGFGSERREFIRVAAAVPVKYRFLTAEFEHPELGRTFDGSTRDLSGGGLLLRVRIPDLAWVPVIVAGNMQVGVTLVLPDRDRPAKAITRVAWLENLDEETGEADLGLRFREMTQSVRDDVLAFIIREKMPD